MTLRGINDRQDNRLGRAVRKIENLTTRHEETREPALWMPLLARPRPGEEVLHGWRGLCNPLVGTGQILQELDDGQPIVSRSPFFTAIVVVPAMDFITRDTSTTYMFLNLTGGIVSEQDDLVLVRIAVKQSGSVDRQGGIWAAINGQNHIQYGRTSGVMAAGGTGKVLPLTESSGWPSNEMPVNLLAAHGGEGISSSLEVIYVRRQLDRMVIGVECEPTTVTTPVGEDFLPVTPLDKAVVVSVDTDLAWDSIWTVFDVFFGQPGALVNVSSGQLAKTFEIPGSLEENTVYQWLVRSTDRRGDDVLSPLWSFTTGPNTPLKVAWATTMQTAMSLAGGAVTFDSQVWSQGVTTSFGLTGGRVEFAVSTGTWNARAIMTASLNKF